MKKFFKVFGFGVIELLTYFLFEVRNLELFFILWTVISIASIGFAILNDSREFIRGGGNVGSGRNNRFHHTQNYFAQKMGESVSTVSKPLRKAAVDYKFIIILGIYLIINIIGMIKFSF